jgi:transposase-like protein
MEENLGNRVSADTISSITDRVLPEIKAWKSRSLEPVYPIAWMDAIHYKVTDERGYAATRAIYNVLVLILKDIRTSWGCTYPRMKEQTFG